MSYAEGVSPFREVEKEAKAPNAYTFMKSLDQDKTCHIAQAADLVIMLTEGMNESKGVYKQQGKANSADWTEVSLNTPLTSFEIVNNFSTIIGKSPSNQMARRELRASTPKSSSSVPDPVPSVVPSQSKPFRKYRWT
jgi:hypothetical protein